MSKTKSVEPTSAFDNYKAALNNPSAYSSVEWLAIGSSIRQLARSYPADSSLYAAYIRLATEAELRAGV